MHGSVMRRTSSLFVLLGLAASCGGRDRDVETAALLQRRVTGAPRHGAARWKAVQAIYADRAYQPLWLDDAKPRREARDLVDALCKAELQGLRLEEYDPAALKAALERAYTGGATETGELVDLDLRLTSLYLDYGADLLAGRLDPARVDTGWYIRTRRATVDSTLREAIRGNGFEAKVAPLIPRHRDYAALIAALARYRETERQGGWPAVPGHAALKPGATGSRVAALQARLAASGDLARGKADSRRYDKATREAVSRFEVRHGLEADGVADAATLAALNVPVATRVRQIELNLERLRWLPSEFGERYVLVNIPDFRLRAFDGGREALTMRVVVGREYESTTPVFADTMSLVVFRPNWNVPAGIVKEEVLPNVRENPYYLAEHDYEVVRGGKDEAVLDPDSIDWEDVDTARIDFRIRQKPGPDNALGLVKFMFPNTFDVYMHDTPAGALFGRQRRALSHGCVRLEHPKQLARFVFAAQPEWTEERIDEAMHADEPTEVTVTRRLPVYIVYLTAFVQDGMLHFREDVYGADARAMARLGRPATPAAAASACSALRALLDR
jgi:L,D-transpeptidase YcbB